MAILHDTDFSELRRILDDSLLTPVFQPIIDFRTRTILGYETLIRGPENSPLHRPDALFAAASALELTLPLERLCRDKSLRAFARLGLGGRLFLNVTPSSLLDPQLINGHTQALLDEIGLPAHRIVLELTEQQRVTDLPDIHAVLAHYRGRGFQIAIDDLGEGFANLRMWSELQPEFVKIDKHFVHGIADDRIKYHFVRAMQDLAGICNAALVAEGIERSEDFNCLREMGIACGQGYFIARPTTQPPLTLPEHALAALDRRQVSVMPHAFGYGKTATAGALLRWVAPLPLSASNDDAVARFESEPELSVLPVVKGEQPVGLLSRQSLIDRFARPFRRELYGAKGCEMFMDHTPLIVDQYASVQELALMLAQAPKHSLLDGFIVTGNGRYLGIGNSQDLMATITEMQISAARYANPLTQLPGNVPINEHIDRILAAEVECVAAYIDIDNFKPFNDHFGYRRGDDLIQLLGRLICEIADTRNDFVGHIGGDDFFVIFQSPHWETLCQDIVHRFSDMVSKMVGPHEQTHGGYLAENRRGELGLIPLPTLSIGIVKVGPLQFESNREVAAAAAEAKKQAKKRLKEQGGKGNIFIEQRRHQSPVTYLN